MRFGYSWNIRKDLPLTEIDHGVFNVITTIDTGPFAGPVKGRKSVTVRQ
jgi:hypothetical protein